MKRWAGIAAAVMLGMSLSLTGCGKAVNKGPSAPLVKTIVIGEDAKDAKDTFSGTVHGFFESPLAFQTGGRIMQRYVTSGERVTAGQELFSVDSKDAEEQAAAARSSLDAAGASLKLAQSTLARYEKLHAANAISDLAMDQTRNSYDLALTQYRSAEAALSRAENNLGFTTLVADRDGIVGTTLYEVGQVVAAGTPVVTIIDDSKLDVYISLTEKQYGLYSVGMPCEVTFWALPNNVTRSRECCPCEVTFWALPGVKVAGKVREVAAAPNAATSTYDAKVTLENPPQDVVVGMTAQVKFTDPDSARGFMVPLSAMASQQASPSVWVIRDGKAHLQKVETGRYGKDAVEITSGLKKGDRVVTAGVARLSEDEEVRV